MICSPLSINISHYLQIQRAEMSFSACHEGVNKIFVPNSITVPSFFNFRAETNVLVSIQGEDCKQTQCQKTNISPKIQNERRTL